jgi:hypothetical protein
MARPLHSLAGGFTGASAVYHMDESWLVLTPSCSRWQVDKTVRLFDPNSIEDHPTGRKELWADRVTDDAHTQDDNRLGAECSGEYSRVLLSPDRRAPRVSNVCIPSDPDCQYMSIHAS